MSVLKRVVKRIVSQPPERINNRIVDEFSAVPGLGLEYENGIHLDFRQGLTDGHYIKIPGNDPVISPFSTLFTFTGDNLSYYMDSAGLLIPSITNIPRLEYNSSGILLGLLIEGARTNLGLQSNDMTNAAWVKTTMTTAKTSIGPDGVANSATRVTASAGNGMSLQTVTSASATRAYSVWLKRITGTGNIDLTVDNGTTWTTKTITTSWARYEITQAAVTNPIFGIRIVTNTDAIDVWCNQLESASFGSSAIPTTSGSVARAADLPKRTIGSEFLASAGTVFAEFDLLSGRSGAGHVFSMSNGTTNERHLAQLSAGNALRYFIADGSVTQADINPGSPALATVTMTKMALTYALNDVNLVLNGTSLGTDAVATMPTPTTFSLGVDQADLQPLFGHIRQIHYWPERKLNSELQARTT